MKFQIHNLDELFYSYIILCVFKHRFDALSDKLQNIFYK